MPPDTPLFGKVYDWSLWILNKTAGFPKRFRHSLTQRIEEITLELEQRLVEANAKRGRDRIEKLQDADALLQALKLNVRRSRDLQCLSKRSYEHAARELNEIGRLLGAWLHATEDRAT